MRKLTVLIMLLAAPLAQAQRMPETVIKIGLFVNARSFNLSCEGKYSAFELNSGDKFDIVPMNDYLVKGNGNRVQIDGRSFESKVRIVPADDKNRVRINGRRYRDSILVTCRDSKLTVINELGIEDYVAGILPREANPEWPLESLKAQAVVSRTYALKNVRKHDKYGFDLCTETHCQVYGGVESEKPRTTEAVEKTKGEVLTYEGKLAQALFHACCGGYTEDPKNVWVWESETPAYLRGRRDKYCADSPHQYWKNRVEGSVIEARLRKSGFNVGKIENIRISGHSRSGRVEMLRIKHSGGTLDIMAAKFRLAVDPWLIKSTLIDKIVRYGDAFEFRGSGWGHGVGMCQWGAKVMSEKGKDYREILEFYYPGTKIEKWDD